MMWTTLYLDISSDKMYLSCNDEELFLERNGIEDVLGKVLVQWQRKYDFRKAYILNGPGGFTNLRVGSLCMNLLNTLVGNQIDFYSVSKIELYAEGYQKEFVERYGIIYIGQKKNIWLWDFEKGGSRSKYATPYEATGKIGQMNFEQLEQIMKDGTITKPFMDTVYDLDYYPDFLKHWAAVYLNYSVWKQLLWEYVEEGKVEPTKSITANYMIDPIVWKK